MRESILPILAAAALACFGSPAASRPFPADPTVGPKNGSLVIVGGGLKDPRILARFMELAGTGAKIIVVPTAAAKVTQSLDLRLGEMFKKAGASSVGFLHTRNPKVADSETFVEPLRDADGVWFSGGRQWRLADAYLGTRTERAFHQVLARGGVIGGSSAGATIQGSYLVRGAPEGNHVMMAPGHERGFSFLKNSAIDQHLLKRKREKDLIPVIRKYPHLLGIGIDEDTAIVVQGDRFEVLGLSRVAIYDMGHQQSPGEPFYHFLHSGQAFDLKTRRIATTGTAHKTGAEQGKGGE